MAFFEEDNGEVKKLKKQITSQDLRIGLLESEKTAAQRQVSELTNKLSTLSTSAAQDSSRATQAEAALSRLQSDFNRQNVEKSNLQQALAKAEERYNQELKGRKFEEQRRDLALDTQLRQEMEQKKKLEDKVKNLESRLSDKEEEARRRDQTPQSGSRGNTDALAKTAALEDELALLKAENIRLRSPSTSAFASSSTSLAGSNDQTPQRGPARRGRASSVSGASSSSASTAPNASRAQVQDLQNLYDEARSDLTRLEARAAKAEKEALKASNEVLAKERQGEKIAADLQTQLRELQEDLKWKKDECDSLAKEVEACEKRLDAAERRAEDLEAAKSQIERQLQESKKGQGSAGASSQQELTRLRSQLSQASDRCEGLELELSSLREQVAGTALSHDESMSAPSSSNANGQQSETRILRELRRSLSQVTAERDTLKREVGDLEDEIERLQASQPTQDSGEGMPELTAELLKRQSTIEELSRQLASTRTQLQQSSKALLVAQEAAQSSPNDQDEGTSERVAQLTEEYAELDNFCNELQGSVAELERKVSGLDRERSDIESERELLRGELEKLKQNGANSSNGDAHESSPHQAAVDLEELRSELEDLKADLADKETAMEQADALAEEDTRQLRMKEAEVMHLTAELSRLRHRAKEASLEIDVLRASANFEGSVDASLDQLRAQLDARDEQLQELRTTLKRREDELDLGKRQLKRVTAFMASRGAAMAADADVSLSTPVKRGSTYRSGVSLDVAATPIAGLFKSKHFFATPGGKQLQRSFEEDLLDQIELIRESIEQAEEQQRFVNAERSANVRALQAELGKKSTDVEHLSVKLSEAENQLSEAIAERKREADADQAALIAEKDLAIQQHQDRITQLETDLAQLQQELNHAQSTLSETEARLESTFASNETSKADLQSQLDAANARAADVADLMQQLLLKRQELMEIETQRRAVEQAEKLDASLKEQAEVLKNVRAEAEEANEALKETAQRLQEELDKVASLEERNAEMSRVEATAEPEQEDHATLRLELAQQEARVAELQSEVAQRQISLDGARVTLAEREQTLAELQSNYDDVVAEAAILKANNASRMESTGESNELQSALAQMQKERQDLEQQLTTLRSAQTDERIEDKNCIARLESQIVDVEARAEALREDKDAAVQSMQRSEERLDQARSEVEALTERLSQAEAEKDARVAELSGLRAQTSVEADAEAVRALEEQVAALTEQAASVEVAHGEATQRLEAELLQALDSAKKAQEARHELECASEELRLQTAEVVRLGAVISELEATLHRRGARDLEDKA
ncbi:hypothetical protein BCV69DRAFT_205817 [Microstroma glucosiphilum]|uniref:Uncharacterized protein n=1 Tax=Pseudomicrostroma glucosiphilum TaxID=1684307 RepID=A0A316U531_9BASI|nr:hypothetical protein BCV69DRAFT_205817 [Pseudomicrostroma glucosiphilum]PWN20310.1 hypothetical protein BCV69DRAFT_205817 [Pseudomicrostroma glucosiphilum]